MHPCPSIVEIDDALSGRSSDVELMRHIDHCDECRRTSERLRANNALAGQLRALKRESCNTEPTPGATALPQLEGYDVVDELSRGAQGVVYRARQRATNRIVALKVLAAGAVATARQRHRFEREVEIVSGLAHPNIVVLHDSKVSADGQLYFVMQYIDGVPLDEWIARRSPGRSDPTAESTTQRRRRAARSTDADVGDILAVFSSICAAVEYAHQRCVIHRDLKPRNILIDADNEPHVLDFGLAKALGRERTEPTVTATQPGVFVGTIAYAAPEQVRGRSTAVDTRTDVYSLGVILFQLLTGQYPYPIEGSLLEIADHIANTSPLPPSAINHSIDGEIDMIVLKALEKDPDRRYASAGALRADIERYVAGEPIDARRDNLLYVLRKRIRRHRRAISMAILMLWLVSLFGIERHRTQQAKLDAHKAELMSSVSALRELLRDDSKRRIDFESNLRERIRGIESQLGVAPLEEAEVVERLGEALQDGGENELAEVYLKRALNTYRRELGPADARTLPVMNDLAVLYQNSNRPQKAQALFESSLELARKLLGPEHHRSLRVLNNLANLHLAQGDNQKALDLYLEGIKIAERSLPQDDPLRLRFMNNIGVAYKHLKRYEQAEKWLKKTLAVQRRLLSPQHRDRIVSLSNLAHLYDLMGRHDAAAPLHASAIAAARLSALGRRRTMGDMLMRYADCLTASGKNDQARVALTNAQEIYAKTCGAESSECKRCARAIAQLAPSNRGP